VDPATLWHATAPAMAPCAALAGPVEADLLVVGGGFAGLSTALHAAEAGLSVVLIEAYRIAWGASGRNAGFVVPNFAKVDPDDLRRVSGPAAERLIGMAAGSGDLVFELIRRHGIDCDALQSGWIQDILPGRQAVSDSRRNLFTFRFDRDRRLISGGMHVLSPGAGTRVPRRVHRRMARELGLPDLPPLAYAWSGTASVMPDYLPRLVDLAPDLVAGFACNGRGIAMSTAMGRELARWACGAALSESAIPAVRPKAIPYHGLARLAPNALLPVSIVKDALDYRRRRA
jgi:glycine/D-amino acid oxidase-like deaminating enzyme